MTNNHVIDGAREVSVTLSDGTEHTARLIGRDDKTDVAPSKSTRDMTFLMSRSEIPTTRVREIGA